ncbi:MAG TPA: GatB/YqeY domain-containing protein [Candidatus Saccharimonadales bacterium]|nr:GatB/YqeY domain-containing protein [Candidatus Saccharimonadales bacterium]
MQEQIERDLKAALLSGDKKKVETLRLVKSVLLNEAISQNARETGLDDDQVTKILSRESKKRAEAAELYEKVGETERAQAEQDEKAIIDVYLPAQLSEEEVQAVVDEELAKMENPSPADMGKVIGAVRSRLGARADGATIARLVKAALEKQ